MVSWRTKYSKIKSIPGIDLVVVAKEQSWPTEQTYSAKDEATENYVLIENQLEKRP